MKVIGSRLCCICLLASSLMANAAEEFPQRAVKMIIPASAGGLADQMGRALAEAMSARLGQPFVVDNKPGAGATMTGVTMVSTKPDGYTIGMITCATLKLPLTTKTSYDPTKHLTYIGRFSGAQLMVAVRADAPWKTLAELIEGSRKAKDGIFYGAVGSAHLFGAQLADVSSLNSWRSVPYKGETDSIVALLSDEVKFLVVTNTIMPFVSSGKVRILGVFGNHKLAGYEDVPTLKELGYTTIDDCPMGLVGPIGMDARVVSTLERALLAATQSAVVKAAAARLSLPIAYVDGATFDSSVRENFVKDKVLVHRLGLIPQ